MSYDENNNSFYGGARSFTPIKSEEIDEEQENFEEEQDVEVESEEDVEEEEEEHGEKRKCMTDDASDVSESSAILGPPKKASCSVA